MLHLQSGGSHLATGSATLASHVRGGVVSPSSDRSPEYSDGAGAIELAVPLLRVLDRYEKRALARRERAIRLCFEG